MANYDNLKVYKAAYDLMLEIFRLENVQRDIKFTLLEDLKKDMIKVIVLIYKANSSTEKNKFIIEAREHIAIVKLYIRMLCDLKQISPKRYSSLAEQAESISKQLTGWQKYNSSNSPTPKNG
jgi:hypothetical protein